MSEQNEPETISSLSQALTQFIDYTGQNFRDHRVQLESQQEQINSLTQLTRQVAEAQVTLMESQTRLSDRFDQVLERIDEMQSEIRGLQTENRRTLELLERRLPPEPES
ncbi:hypothetical protein ACQ4M3_08885 [Leptolyngbya sp. AN03gr2]|uniref:hypothetical protein n=1 Tax=unclassified Leptolyngbya TaxID=2650499 RepID=UPI003D31ECF7